MKLIMCKGLPASGKSTWAKAQNAFRVNKDDLRSMMNNGKWSRTNEKYILLVRDAIIKLHLGDGNTVIVDDTNLAPKHEERLKQLARENKATFEIKDFTEVTIEECIKRDLARPVSVGEKVIRDMYNQFLKPKPEVIKYDPNLKDVVLCDLDGTIALFGDANPYERDFTKDEVNYVVKGILLGAVNAGVIFVSGRQDKFREQTEKWLHKVWGPNHKLFMRPTGDMRKDYIVKKEIYENFIKGKYNVRFILDDRNQTVNGWRELGLTCLQVADGNF